MLGFVMAPLSAHCWQNLVRYTSRWVASYLQVMWAKVCRLSALRWPRACRSHSTGVALVVIGEDEFKNIYAAVSGKHPIDIIIYGIQSRLQDNILQLYHTDSQLRHVLLFHECSFNATCVDLTIGVCTSLRRHRAHIQRISKYKSFEFTQVGRSRTFTKATYFIALSAARNVNSFEVYSPS